MRPVQQQQVKLHLLLLLLLLLATDSFGWGRRDCTYTAKTQQQQLLLFAAAFSK